jgi:hypothetical protein
MGLTDMLQDPATRNKMQDFAQRYDQGAPWEGISDDEAREQHDRVAAQLDDRARSVRPTIRRSSRARRRGLARRSRTCSRR